jgi:hypothetical protein
MNPGGPPQDLLAHLAAKALKPAGRKRYEGIQALGILKADVDHLGMSWLADWRGRNSLYRAWLL